MTVIEFDQRVTGMSTNPAEADSIQCCGYFTALEHIKRTWL